MCRINRIGHYVACGHTSKTIKPYYYTHDKNHVPLDSTAEKGTKANPAYSATVINKADFCGEQWHFVKLEKPEFNEKCPRCFWLGMGAPGLNNPDFDLDDG